MILAHWSHGRIAHQRRPLVGKPLRHPLRNRALRLSVSPAFAEPTSKLLHASRLTSWQLPDQYRKRSRLFLPRLLQRWTIWIGPLLYSTKSRRRLVSARETHRLSSTDLYRSMDHYLRPLNPHHGPFGPNLRGRSLSSRLLNATHFTVHPLSRQVPGNANPPVRQIRSLHLQSSFLPVTILLQLGWRVCSTELLRSNPLRMRETRTGSSTSKHRVRMLASPRICRPSLCSSTFGWAYC
jgi:hypothetical protein